MIELHKIITSRAYTVKLGNMTLRLHFGFDTQFVLLLPEEIISNWYISIVGIGLI